MASLQNTQINDTGFVQIPKGSTAQRPASPSVGMLRFNTEYDSLEYYNGRRWVDPNTGLAVGAGLTSETAARSAEEILHVFPDSADGVYWIDLPTIGPQQIYCVMDKDWDGGGWMLAMKATRGTTFNYNSSYWTSKNTLNTSDTNLNDGDAKFHVFNYYKAKDIMARFPDVAAGGTISNSLGGWTWNEADFTEGNNWTADEFFANKGANQYLRENADVTNWAGHAGGPFSAQGGWRKYGFNLNDGARQARWGFLWNNETFPGSNDVESGVGLGSRPFYSAGDYVTCCQTYTGVRRSMRMEIFIR